MATVNLKNEDQQLVDGNDSIVIVDNLQSIRGGRSLNVVGFEPSTIRAGHVIIKETATGEFKPMPATDLKEDGVASVGTVTAGTGYTNGTYENVPLSGGSGKGCLATVVVALTVVSTVTITQKGEGYVVGDVLSVPADYAGGTGSGASVPVASVSDTAAAYSALPAGHTYAGILISSILTKKPFAGILVRGTVNPAAAPYSMTSILSAVKSALPLIDFRED